MKNTKLIQLLETFSVSELNEFGKFLNSPFHNESSKMRLLYNFLKRHHPHFNHKDLTKENAYNTIYPDEKYDDKKLRERFSDMMRLAEEYLSLVYIKKHPLELKKQTLFEFSARGLDIHFDKKYKEISEILHKTEAKTIDYFLNEYNNEKIRSDFYFNRKLTGKRKSNYDELVLETHRFLNYFSAQMISDFCIMYNWREQLNYKFEYQLYEPIMKFIEKNNLREFPLINCCYAVMKIRENEDDDKLYYELKDIYIKNINLLDTENKIRVGTILSNDALRRFMKEKKGFDSERFEIMKLVLEHEVYTKESGWLSREQYFNYVLIPLSLGELEWAEKFIKNYTIKVAPDKRDYAHLYVKSLLHYNKKEYNSALEKLSTIKGGDFNYFMRIKVLQSKIYFEMGDYERVLTIIAAFKHYNSSNPLIPEQMKKRYTNYINILNKLTLLKFDNDEFKCSKLIKEIKDFSIDELTTNKSWLLEKAVELKK